jgi:hypothetical protein
MRLRHGEAAAPTASAENAALPAEPCACLGQASPHAALPPRSQGGVRLVRSNARLRVVNSSLGALLIFSSKQHLALLPRVRRLQLHAITDTVYLQVLSATRFRGPSAKKGCAQRASGW